MNKSEIEDEVADCLKHAQYCAEQAARCNGKIMRWFLGDRYGREWFTLRESWLAYAEDYRKLL